MSLGATERGLVHGYEIHAVGKGQVDHFCGEYSWVWADEFQDPGQD